MTRQRGLSWARRWKRWWNWDWRSSTTRPHEVHSVIERRELVVAQRPCPAEQYGHFILSIVWFALFCFRLVVHFGVALICITTVYL